MNNIQAATIGDTLKDKGQDIPRAGKPELVKIPASDLAKFGLSTSQVENFQTHGVTPQNIAEGLVTLLNDADGSQWAQELKTLTGKRQATGELKALAQKLLPELGWRAMTVAVSVIDKLRGLWVREQPGAGATTQNKTLEIPGVQELSETELAGAFGLKPDAVGYKIPNQEKVIMNGVRHWIKSDDGKEWVKIFREMGAPKEGKPSSAEEIKAKAEMTPVYRLFATVFNNKVRALNGPEKGAPVGPENNGQQLYYNAQQFANDVRWLGADKNQILGKVVASLMKLPDMKFQQHDDTAVAQGAASKVVEYLRDLFTYAESPDMQEILKNPLYNFSEDLDKLPEEEKKKWEDARREEGDPTNRMSGPQLDEEAASFPAFLASLKLDPKEFKEHLSTLRGQLDAVKMPEKVRKSLMDFIDGETLTLKGDMSGGDPQHQDSVNILKQLLEAIKMAYKSASSEIKLDKGALKAEEALAQLKDKMDKDYQGIQILESKLKTLQKGLTESEEQLKSDRRPEVLEKIDAYRDYAAKTQAAIQSLVNKSNDDTEPLRNETREAQLEVLNSYVEERTSKLEEVFNNAIAKISGYKDQLSRLDIVDRAGLLKKMEETTKEIENIKQQLSALSEKRQEYAQLANDIRTLKTPYKAIKRAGAGHTDVDSKLRADYILVRTKPLDPEKKNAINEKLKELYSTYVFLKDLGKNGQWESVFRAVDAPLSQLRDTQKRMLGTEQGGGLRQNFSQLEGLVKKYRMVVNEFKYLMRLDKSYALWNGMSGAMYNDAVNVEDQTDDDIIAHPDMKSAEDFLTWIREGKTLRWLWRKMNQMAINKVDTPYVTGLQHQVRKDDLPKFMSLLDQISFDVSLFRPGLLYTKVLKKLSERSDLGKGISKMEESEKKKNREKEQKTKAIGTPKQAAEEENIKTKPKRAQPEDKTSRPGGNKYDPAKQRKQWHPLRHRDRSELRPSTKGSIGVLISPDGLDEFITELERNNFNFVESLAKSDTKESMGLESGHQPVGLSLKDLPLGAAKDEYLKGDVPMYNGLDETVAKTILKGTANLRDKVLENGPHMLQDFKNRIKLDQDQLASVEKTIADLKEQEKAVSGTHSKKLEALAAFGLNPEQAISAALENDPELHAFYESEIKNMPADKKEELIGESIAEGKEREWVKERFPYKKRLMTLLERYTPPGKGVIKQLQEAEEKVKDLGHKAQAAGRSVNEDPDYQKAVERVNWLQTRLPHKITIKKRVGVGEGQVRRKTEQMDAPEALLNIDYLVFDPEESDSAFSEIIRRVLETSSIAVADGARLRKQLVRNESALSTEFGKFDREKSLRRMQFLTQELSEKAGQLQADRNDLDKIEQNLQSASDKGTEEYKKMSEQIPRMKDSIKVAEDICTTLNNHISALTEALRKHSASENIELKSRDIQIKKQNLDKLKKELEEAQKETPPQPAKIKHLQDSINEYEGALSKLEQQHQEALSNPHGFDIHKDGLAKLEDLHNRALGKPSHPGDKGFVWPIPALKNLPDPGKLDDFQWEQQYDTKKDEIEQTLRYVDQVRDLLTNIIGQLTGERGALRRDPRILTSREHIDLDKQIMVEITAQAARRDILKDESQRYRTSMEQRRSSLRNKYTLALSEALKETPKNPTKIESLKNKVREFGGQFKEDEPEEKHKLEQRDLVKEEKVFQEAWKKQHQQLKDQGKTAASDSGDAFREENSWEQLATPASRLEKEQSPATRDWQLINKMLRDSKDKLDGLKEVLRKGQVAGDPEKTKEISAHFLQAQDRYNKLSKLSRVRVRLDDGTPEGLEVRISDAPRLYKNLEDEEIGGKGSLNIQIRNHQGLLDNIKTRIQENKRMIDNYGQDGESFKGFTRKEQDSIINQFWGSLYWTLMQRWSSKVGQEVMFGRRDMPPFLDMYNAFKNVTGVRSNSVLQKVLRGADDAKRTAKQLEKEYRTMIQKYRAAGQNPLEVDMDKLKADMEKDGKEFTEDAVTEMDQDKLPLKNKAVNELRIRINNLKGLAGQKNAMYRVMSDAVSTDVMIKTLTKIRSETTNEKLKSEIDSRINKINDEQNKAFLAVEGQVEDESKALSQELMTISPTAQDTPEPAATATHTETPKQASYRSSPHFDLKHLYSKVIQDKIAAMALNN